MRRLPVTGADDDLQNGGDVRSPPITEVTVGNRPAIDALAARLSVLKPADPADVAEHGVGNGGSTGSIAAGLSARGAVEADYGQGQGAAIVNRVPAIWQDLEFGAPQIARLGMTRLNAGGVALLGTLRRDGSPRISPVEPHLAEGHLLIGAMARSGKAADLLGDPRILHSTVTGPDTGDGELELYGSAVEAGQHLRGVAAQAWWSAWPPDKAIVFSLHIEQAVFIDWDTAHGLMSIHRWSPQRGYSNAKRTYP